MTNLARAIRSMTRTQTEAGDSPVAAEIQAIRTRCWNGALHTFATLYIFQQRARALNHRLQLVTYVGFMVPMLVGLLVLSYGHFKSLPTVISIASAIGAVQVVISLWSIIGGWVDGYSYAVKSIGSNSRLAAKFEELASNPPADRSTLRREYERLTIQDECRQEDDYEQGVKESEKRMGMRAALRNYQRRCAACNEVPTTMEPTDCGVCGNFKHRSR